MAVLAGIDTLVLGAFLASEKYASGKRQQAALKEKLAKQPQGVYYDSTNKQTPVVHGDAKKTKSMVQIGTYNPKEGFGSTKLYPKPVLDLIMPKSPELGKVSYYQSQKAPFTQYSSVASLKQAEGADTPYRTIQFDQKTKEMGLPSEKIFDKKEPVKIEKNVFLDNDLKKIAKKPVDGYRAVEINENGVTRYDIKETIKKEKVEKDKREVTKEKVETVYTIDGETGTINELIAKRVLSSEEANDLEEVGAVPIGERNIKIYDDGSIDSGSFSQFNQAILKTISPEFYEEKKDKTKYYANIISKATGLSTTGYELTGDWKSEKRNLENKGYVVLDVYTKKDGKVTYETFDKNAKNSAVSDADAGAFTLASFKFEGPYGKATNIKAPKDVGKPDVRSSFLFQANNQVSDILMNSTYKEAFYKEPKKVNKIAVGLESIILQEYTKEGVQGVPSLKFYIPLATGPNSFIDRYPSLANMQLNVDGMQMSYADYLLKKQQGQITRETMTKMLGIDQANKKNNLPSKTVGTTKNITTADGTALVYPVLTTYTNPSHIKAVNSVLKLAKNQSEVDYYSNIIQNKLTVYTDVPNPQGGGLVPALNQPALEFFNTINSKQFTRMLTVGGKQIPVKGFQLLKAVMNPKYTIDGASTANLIGSDLRIKLSNQVREAGGGDLNKIADILDVALDRNAGADIDITLNNMHKFPIGEEQKGKNKLVLASADMAKATSQAIAEADQLEGTFFDAQGNMYPEGSGLAQLYLFVDDGLYTFGYLKDKTIGMIRSVLGKEPKVLDAYSYNYEQVLGGALKRVNEFRSVYDNPETAEKYKGQEEKETEAKASNRERLEKIVRQMDAVDKNGKADEKARNFARRNFHKYMLAYQLAAAIQGGTGGRTISDQDVQNILNAFNFTPLSKPQNELATIRAAKAMLRRLNTYHNAIASLAGVGGNDPKNKRRARLVLEADKFLASSQSYSVNNGITSDDVALFIRDKGKAIGSGAGTGGDSLQPVSPKIQEEFDFTNKILNTMPS